jgi:hypothetical protein
MTTSPPAWSRHLAATHVVRRQAPDPAARHDLLEMLGLIRPGTRLLTPDDDNSYDDVAMALVRTHRNGFDDTRALPAHGTVEGAKVLHGDGVLCLRCKAAAVRADHLAAVAATPPPPRAKKPQAKPAPAPRVKKPTPAKPAPVRQPSTRTRPPCGTSGGYSWHLRQKKLDPTHQACQPCKDAAATRQRDYETARKQKGTPRIRRATPASAARPANTSPTPTGAPTITPPTAEPDQLNQATTHTHPGATR